mgnify:CR=1 FL=1
MKKNERLAVAAFIDKKLCEDVIIKVEDNCIRSKYHQLIRQVFSMIKFGPEQKQKLKIRITKSNASLHKDTS